MSKIIFFIDNIERLRFFKRFESTCHHTFKYITFKSSIYFILKLKGMDVTLLKMVNSNNYAGDELYCKSLDILQGHLSEKSATDIYTSLEYYFSTINNDNTYVVVWNGTRFSGRVIHSLRKKYSYKTIFLELSNFPGAIFVDPDGVNAESKIYNLLSHGEINLPSANSLDDNWFDEYRRFKLEPPKQLKYVGKINPYYVVDMFFQYLHLTPKECTLSFFDRLNIIVGSKVNAGKLYGDIEDLSCKYIFLPLQVSSDSQIIINSDIDNKEAIKLTHNRAKYINAKLYVKIHPSEMDSNFISDVRELISSLDNCFLVGNDTVQLISNCTEVAVINSTVGLEAKLQNKPVTIYGRALYSYINDNISSFMDFVFLKGVDYFSEELIDIDLILNKINSLDKISKVK